MQKLDFRSQVQVRSRGRRRAGLSREPRRDQEEGGGTGLSQDSPGRDQEQGGGAGFRKLDCPLLQLFLNSCATDIVFVTLLCTALETASSEVHKLLRSGEVPTSLI